MQISDERNEFKRKEHVFQSEKKVLKQMIVESEKEKSAAKEFGDEKKIFETQVRKLTSKLAGLSSDIMKEQRMRSDL